MDAGWAVAHDGCHPAARCCANGRAPVFRHAKDHRPRALERASPRTETARPSRRPRCPQRAPHRARRVRRVSDRRIRVGRRTLRSARHRLDPPGRTASGGARHHDGLQPSGAGRPGRRLRRHEERHLRGALHGGDARLGRLHRGSAGAEEVRPARRQGGHSSRRDGVEDPRCRGGAVEARRRVHHRAHRCALCRGTPGRQGAGGDREDVQGRLARHHDDGRRRQDALAPARRLRRDGLLDGALPDQHPLPRGTGDGAGRGRPARGTPPRHERGDDQGRVHKLVGLEYWQEVEKKFQP